MFLTYLAYIITQFPLFYFAKLPVNLVVFYKNSLREIDNRYQFELNLRLFFVPLYGDTHWALRIAGILYRLFKALIGLIFFISYTFLYFLLAVALLFGPFISIFYSFELFLFLLLVYFLSYITYYIFNPVDPLSYDKNYYTLFEVYKMSDFSGRKILPQLSNTHVLTNAYKEFSEFIEKDTTELISLIENYDFNNKTVASSIISSGKISGYRHANKELVLSGFLNAIPEFNNYLRLNNLPAFTLQTYLVSHKFQNNLHRAKIWDADYASNYSFPYNAVRLDRATPTLNKFSMNFKPSRDNLVVTYLEKFKKYRLELTHILDEGKKKILVVGRPGTGKTSIVRDFYLSIQKGHVPQSLKFNRIVNLDLSSIVSLGGDGPEALNTVLKEFSSLKSTILFLDNLHTLYAFSGLDYISILLPYFEDPNLKIICTVDYKDYQDMNRNYPGLDNVFRKIFIEEIENKELYDFLVIKNKDYKHKLSLPAIQFLVSSTSQILFDKYNPQKSINLIEQAHGKGINTTFVTKKDIAEVIKSNTGVSLGSVTQKESKNLLNLEQSISKEVFGQEAAVREVSNSLIRSRGTRGNSSKPIASFLFAGPTGVGKTELAKSLARNYFGGEKEIIRLDMSEYQTEESINRLIGSEDGSKQGLLTQAIKETPFNLILLDEIEKASNSIHMLFLQVLDDGRLTDANGNTVYFKNTIIIATTNAGTSRVIDNFSNNMSYEDVRKNFMVEIKKHFPPEFLNRFSEIILFKPLNTETLSKILDIKFKLLKKEVYDSYKISVDLSDGLKSFLMQKGFSKEWGARSLERVLEKVVKTALSKALLQNDIKAGDELVLDKRFIAKYTNSI